jgi:hypothetical protein
VGQGRSGQVRKISPPPGFNPRTVQPAASRYIDYAVRPAALDVRPTFSFVRSATCVRLETTNQYHSLIYLTTGPQHLPK